MNAREEARRRVEAVITEHPESGMAETVAKIGMERYLDVVTFSWTDVDLRHWPEPEFRAAIRDMRRAFSRASHALNAAVTRRMS